jgi:uncharacterized protein
VRHRAISALFLLALGVVPALCDTEADFVGRLVAAGIAQTATKVRYDGSYRRIGYPGGDVPADLGVCTDVVIRAYRKLGIDLQVRVHEDMARAFEAYPKLWGLDRPDTNIDHRRVQNLQTFLRRHGAAVAAPRRVMARATQPAISSLGCCPAISRTSASSRTAVRPTACDR